MRLHIIRRCLHLLKFEGISKGQAYGNLSNGL